jgi:hypothetical protein
MAIQLLGLMAPSVTGWSTGEAPVDGLAPPNTNPLVGNVAGFVALRPRSPLPDIQFAINDYIPPAKNLQGVTVRFPPVYTSFTTFALTRIPTQADQATLAHALDVVEQTYPFRPSGVFTAVGYGLPYFTRLPGGLTGSLVSSHLPRLISTPPGLRWRRLSRDRPTSGAIRGPPSRLSTFPCGSNPMTWW